MTTEASSTNTWLQWQQAMIDETIGNFQKLGKLPGVLEKAQKIRKGVTPSEVVYEEDRVKLLRYLPKGEIRHKTPLIFVFALVNRPYILDLKESRSVVAHFVEAGYDTYLVDWGVPTHSDRHLTLDDHINGYIDNVVDYVRERNGVDQVNLLGYCMGGTMSSIYTSLHQEKVKNLILLAAGIDFSTREGLLNLWTDKENFNVDQFIDTFGNCPPEFLQSSFLMLKPVQNLIEKPLNFWENIENEKFIDDFLTMETWLNDNIPVPGEVYRQFVKNLYQENRLVQGTMPIGKHVIDLGNITCPVMNLMAQFDDLVPFCQSMPFNNLVSSKDRDSILLKAGHIGLAMGSRAQREVWPKVVQWLADRD